jgi:hypothetical protein
MIPFPQGILPQRQLDLIVSELHLREVPKQNQPITYTYSATYDGRGTAMRIEFDEPATIARLHTAQAAQANRSASWRARQKTL